ncbi:dihydrofolate reductase family protein [Pollutibacter soli]|uniref:dihydrofolate reductase family protein n=1 Tax=Pollutibacter soli TaxID=3034157 RepID=UPI003013E639
MSPEKFAITIHMVSSLDGFIARKDNSVSWFDTSDHFEKGVDIPDEEEFNKTVDCYIMGSRTYEHALELSGNYGWAYGETPTIIVSQRSLPVNRKNVELYNGSLMELIDCLKSKYKNVWLVGGAQLAKEFIRLHLADELRISILPIMLGDGLLLFDHIGIEQSLHLKNVTGFRNGMVELWYEINKTGYGMQNTGTGRK